MGNILSDFLIAISGDQQQVANNDYLHAILDIYYGVTNKIGISPSVIKFFLDDKAANNAIATMKGTLECVVPNGVKELNTPLTYLFDELICNIQQHAQTDKGYAYVGYIPSTDYIEIAIADEGITIYGSYVSAQKHIELLGDSDAFALNLAQKGYSVKNLPDTENRGYGISSNMRMVVDGLKGEFAVLSGNALLIQVPGRKEILSLPSTVDFKGTMVMVRIPATIPPDFDFYKYIG